MSISDTLLAYEDAMELYMLTNPFGDGSSSSTTSSGSQATHQGDSTLSSANVEQRGLGSVQTVSSVKDLPPHLQDMVHDFIGKEASP